MRKSRGGMVQTDSQYCFIWQVLDDIMKEKQLKNNSKKPNSYRLSVDLISSSDDSSDSSYESSDDEYDEHIDNLRCVLNNSNNVNNEMAKRPSIICHQ